MPNRLAVCILVILVQGRYPNRNSHKRIVVIASTAESIEYSASIHANALIVTRRCFARRNVPKLFVTIVRIINVPNVAQVVKLYDPKALLRTDPTKPQILMQPIQRATARRRRVHLQPKNLAGAWGGRHKGVLKGRITESTACPQAPAKLA